MWGKGGDTIYRTITHYLFLLMLVRSNLTTQIAKEPLFLLQQTIIRRPIEGNADQSMGSPGAGQKYVRTAVQIKWGGTASPPRWPRSARSSGKAISKQETRSLFPGDTHLPWEYLNGKQMGPTQSGFPRCTNCL